MVFGMSFGLWSCGDLDLERMGRTAPFERLEVGLLAIGLIIRPTGPKNALPFEG
jgi:hypothetical protein